MAPAVPSVQRYLDVLAGAFMVRPLPAWHENLGKRQVRAPKVYVRDSGLLCASATGATAHASAARTATVKTFPALLTVADSTAASESAACPAPAPRAARSPSCRPATGTSASCAPLHPVGVMSA